jgi:7-cyano-7-deazaguanine synthase in queuosine biosynthesis
MNALNVRFKFAMTNGDRSVFLQKNLHFCMYPTGKNGAFGEVLNKRQIDLLRIGMSIHTADGWVRRPRSTNGHRRPVIDVEVLDSAFWTRTDTYSRLKACVDFLSGNDDWSFRFHQSLNARHHPRPDLFRGRDLSALVALYSGGLDSAAGLAVRLSQAPGRMVIPVSVRYQMQKEKLIRDHFKLLMDAGLVSTNDLKPFQAAVYIKNTRIKEEFDFRLREISHRCRPILFMLFAGLVADSVSSPEVEIFESGVGAVNLPLVSGVIDYRTTRSTHPHFLRLISDLVSHVSERGIGFVLPFAHLTKAEMVKQAKELGLEKLLCKSVSCILHPIRRSKNRQCGHCPACVYRRQAMITAGVDEGQDAYDLDLFSSILTRRDVQEKFLQPIRAFHQQACKRVKFLFSSRNICMPRILFLQKANSALTSRFTAVIGENGRS